MEEEVSKPAHEARVENGDRLQQTILTEPMGLSTLW